MATDRPDDLEGLLAYIDRNFDLVIAASRSEVLADADLRSAVAVVFTEQPSDVDARDFCRRIDPRWQNRPKVVAAGSRGAAWTSFVDHQVPIDGMIYLDDPDDQQIGAFGILASLRAEAAIAALGGTAAAIWQQSCKLINTVEILVASGQPIPRGAIQSLCAVVVDAADESVLSAMVRVLRDHHSETMVHSLDVGLNVLLLGRHVGIRSRSDQFLLFEAGLLHDIGKLKIPPAILRKPAGLTAGELAAIRRHPIDGARILRDSGGYDDSVITAAGDHHEKLDGSGYPHGLKGSQISEVGCLTAVCDVYCALTERRSYKSSSAPAEAFQIIEEMAGSHLDPVLVKRLVEMVHGFAASQQEVG
ncbi:MAG: HD domain-containing protein [Rhodospirillaceae bacterium]|nr:HD domain-containing protein [Rhodospirillaceae bacterium]